MVDTKAYKYYQLEKTHLKDVQYIFLKAFNKKVSIDYLIHKYDTSYLGIKPVATIAYDNQKPIAFYGAIPQLFELNGDKFLIALACDSYTLPQYQKKGLHYNLALRSYELMKKYDLKLVYAFHSENTYYSTKKLNWIELPSMKRFHIHTGALPIAKVINKLRLNKLFSRLMFSVFKPYIIQTAENPLAMNNKLHQRYSKSFYKYKESFNPHFIISINNCIFYVKCSSILHIGYIDYKNIASLKAALETLTKLCKKMGISEILFQLDSTTKQHKELSILEEGLPSWKMGYLLFDEQIDISKIGFNYADVDTF
jgi:hypothetical protein